LSDNDKLLKGRPEVAEEKEPAERPALYCALGVTVKGGRQGHVEIGGERNQNALGKRGKTQNEGEKYFSGKGGMVCAVGCR